jgi:hypothetical protein
MLFMRGDLGLRARRSLDDLLKNAIPAIKRSFVRKDPEKEMLLSFHDDFRLAGAGR